MIAGLGSCFCHGRFLRPDAARFVLPLYTPKQASRYYYYIIQKMRASSKMGFRFVPEPETSKFKKIAFDLSIRNALLVLLHFVLSVERDLCS